MIMVIRMALKDIIFYRCSHLHRPWRDSSTLADTPTDWHKNYVQEITNLREHTQVVQWDSSNVDFDRAEIGFKWNSLTVS